MSENKLYGRWGILRAIVHKCAIMFLNAVPYLPCLTCWTTPGRYRWWEMQPGPSLTSAVEKIHNRTGNSSSPHCRCSQSWFTHWMKKCLSMLAGLFLISQMVQTKKSKLSSNLESLEDSLNYSCILIMLYFPFIFGINIRSKPLPSDLLATLLLATTFKLRSSLTAVLYLLC